MAEDTTSTSQAGSSDGLIIPDEAKQKYPDIVKLIQESESMNTEERNYWLQVLPVMNEEQVKELRDILETEKAKLKAIDEKYATAQPKEEPKVDLEEVARKKREAQEERKRKEEEHRKQEEEEAEDLLSELENL